MNKKEIYEHLANIYLDASSKTSQKKRKLNTFPKGLQGLILAGLVLILTSGSLVTYSHLHSHNLSAQIALFLYQDTAKINFNFDPAKKETLSLNLNQLDLSKYKILAFSVKKNNPQDLISLRIEFVNRFNEKSEIYLKNVPSKWSDYKIDFGRFVKISDWKEMKVLAFSIEEWNAKEKSGVVYLDNIRVLK